MDLLIFIAGVILGYFIEKILDIVLKNTTKIYKQKIWQKAERIWNKIQDISEGLELIEGWMEKMISLMKIKSLSPSTMNFDYPPPWQLKHLLFIITNGKK